MTHTPPQTERAVRTLPLHNGRFRRPGGNAGCNDRTSRFGGVRVGP